MVLKGIRRLVYIVAICVCVGATLFALLNRAHESSRLLTLQRPQEIGLNSGTSSVNSSVEAVPLEAEDDMEGQISTRLDSLAITSTVPPNSSNPAQLKRTKQKNANQTLQQKAASLDSHDKDAPNYPTKNIADHADREKSVSPAVTNKAGPKAIAEGRMNVLYIVADDLRPELGAYGRIARTPHIDMLARRGVVFDRAYAQIAVCNPSRVSFMTGRVPDVAEVWHFEAQAPAGWTSISTMFAESGYYSLAFGKLWHWCCPGSARHQFPDNIPVTGRPYWSYLGDLMQHAYETEIRKVEPLQDGARSFSPADDLLDQQFADRAVHALQELASLQRNQSQVRPFFMGVGFLRPHLPFNFPKAFWDLYSDLDGQFPPIPWPLLPEEAPPYARGDVHSIFLMRGEGKSADMFYCQQENQGPRQYFKGSNCTAALIQRRQMEFQTGVLRNIADMSTAWPLPARAAMPNSVRQELIRGYLAAVSFMDAQVGRLLDALTLNGFEDNTIIVFHSDHGYAIGDHGQFGKRSLYEHDTRVPLVVSDPRRPEGHGSHAQSFVSLVDVLPTLADLAGIELTTEVYTKGAPHLPSKTSLKGRPLSGTSVTSLLDGPEAERRACQEPSPKRKCGRIASVSQFAKCAMDKDALTRANALDFRNGLKDALYWGCGANGKLGAQYSGDKGANGLVLMGYSIRVSGWRYTAWLLWAPDATGPLWLYPPFGEELYDHRKDDFGSNPGGTFDKAEGVSLAREGGTAPLRWMLFLALKAMVNDDALSGELRGGSQLGIGADVADLASLGLKRWADAPGTGLMPTSLGTKLDELGLMPPLHPSLPKSVAPLFTATKRPQFNGTKRGESSSRAMYESSGSGLWPRAMNQEDVKMYTFELHVNSGDLVEVTSASENSWEVFQVCAILPRVTLRGERGVSLVLEKKLCRSPTVASSQSAAEAFADGNVNREEMIIIPSRIAPVGNGWTAGLGQRYWKPIKKTD